MNKLYFILGLIITSTNSYAQTTCANATAISPGIHTVSDVNSGQVPNPDCAENFGQLRTGGRWFSFTASVNGVAKVTSDLASNSAIDTRLHIYSGDCNTLTCVDGNDDIDAFGNVRFSEVIWPVSTGVTYYVAWDNQWSASGFDFELTETALTCNNNLPLTEDFDSLNTFFGCYQVEDADGNASDWGLQSIDMDGDGTDEDYATNGTNSNIAKNDWLFSPAINLTTGNSYTVNFKYNGGNGTFPANETLEVLFVDGPSSSANVLQSLFIETGITRTGNFSQGEALATSESVQYTSTATGTYYLAFNATSPVDSGSLLLFDFSVTEETLSVQDLSKDTFQHFFDKDTDDLTLRSTNGLMHHIEIFNLLGQRVLRDKFSSTDRTVNLSTLVDGLYLVSVGFNDGQSVFKLLKN